MLDLNIGLILEKRQIKNDEKLLYESLTGDILVLYNKEKKYKLPIKNNSELIKSIFLNLKTSKFNLQELKGLEIIDFEKIRELKAYIDNLVFALYFKIKISQDDIKSIENVKKLCVENKYYEQL